MRVCEKIKLEFVAQDCFFIYSFIQHTTSKSISQHIVKRSVCSKAVHNFRHADVSTVKYTVANTIMFAESTYYTLLLFTVKCPRRTMSIQIAFKVRSRWLSERVKNSP